MEIVSIFNIKGGCGKTLTAQALIEGLRMERFKVCAIDLDTQHNLSDSFNFKPSFTISDLVFNSKPLSEIYRTDFIASNLTMAYIDINRVEKETFINLFSELSTYYDYVIIDMPPTLNNLASIILSLSDSLVIPSESDIYNLNGVKSLLNIVKKSMPNLRVRGVLLTRFNERNNISKALNNLLTELTTTYNTRVFNTKIRESVAIKELRATTEPLLTYGGGKSNAQKDYKAFIKEFLESEE